MVKKKELTPEPEAALRVENISKKFGNFQAIEGVSFQIQRGEVLGFLGPNGAGKTTTMRILTGFFPPTQGKVWIGPLDLQQKPNEAKKRIGYLPESISIYPELRVAEFLKFSASLKGVSGKNMKSHLEEKMERCGLMHVQNRLIGTLSKGYRQRIGIAQALVGDPEIIILDEPTNGLDPKQIIEIRQLIRELGKEKTLILSTHILSEVSAVCTRVLIMNKGRIVATGTSDELEAGLKKTSEIYVLIANSGSSKEKALELLRALPGVEKVNITEENKEQVGLSVLVSKTEDLRPEISKVFAQNHIALLEMRSGRLSLEDIFMKIVLSEEAGVTA